MLEIVPNGCFTWNFTLFEKGKPIANFDLAWFHEAGELVVGDTSFNVYREGVMNGSFVLKAGGEELARAEKPSVFVRSFTIDYGKERYTLKAESPFLRKFVLWKGSRQIGSISPHSMFTRRATADFPETLPLPVRVFMILLVIFLWRRAARSN